MSLNAPFYSATMSREGTFKFMCLNYHVVSWQRLSTSTIIVGHTLKTFLTRRWIKKPVTKTSSYSIIVFKAVEKGWLLSFEQGTLTLFSYKTRFFLPLKTHSQWSLSPSSLFLKIITGKLHETFLWYCWNRTKVIAGIQLIWLWNTSKP